MSHRRTLARLTVASLAATALAAPAATAVPVDPTGPRPADMHGSETATPDRSGPPVRHPRLLPPPVWPGHSTPINRAPAQFADGDGEDASVLALVVGGTLLLGGGMAVTAVRLRARTVH